jgi:hypothetical protein
MKCTVDVKNDANCSFSFLTYIRECINSVSSNPVEGRTKI